VNSVTRRTAMVATGAAFAAAITGCDQAANGSGATGNGGTGKNKGKAKVTLIGDGSTSDTGPQPHQPKLPSLKPGMAPPQFVVFSWDGGAETGDHMLTRFRKVMKDVGGSMTIFLSGLYLLPRAKADLYKPPRNRVGASDIGYLTDESIRRTITGVRDAWLEGHEIGTHFNGHFCGGSGSVGNWSTADWTSEIEQAEAMVMKWKTNTGFTDLPPFPFDYRTELIGSRAPCLMGQEALLPAAVAAHWRYDSSVGAPQVWPKHYADSSLWLLPMSQVPFPGHTFEVIAMDYNYMANQAGPKPTKDPTNYAKWKAEALGALVAGHERAVSGNRAPLIIGNHFETWNGGIYMDAVEEAMRKFGDAADTYLVSFRQLVQWLDAQNPALLAELRDLPVGQAPAGGWASFGAHASSAPSTDSAEPDGPLGE
jgi:hypothetical protein